MVDRHDLVKTVKELEADPEMKAVLESRSATPPSKGLQKRLAKEAKEPRGD